MNIVNKLTLRHIQTHMRRSVLTVMSIIVSVAMVTAVFTSAISFVKFFQNVTLKLDGNWHAEFFFDGVPDMDYFEQAENIDAFSQVNNFAMISTEESFKSTRKRTDIIAADQSVVDLRNIKITSGEYPSSSRELLVSQKYIDANKLSLKVGDEIGFYQLNYADNSEEYVTYRVSGICDGKASFMRFCGAVTLSDDALSVNDSTYVTVRYKTLDSTIYDVIEQTKEECGATQVTGHYDLFNYSGIVRDNQMLWSLGGFAGIILAIIVIVSVFMIYDSFAVSYQERARYLGMLASVGATKRQKRSSIYFEGFILGLVGIPLGILAGIGGIAVTFKGIQGAFQSTLAVDVEQTLRVYVNPFVIIGSVIISAVTILISCYIPARKASKSTAIEAIREQNTVKVKAKGLKTNRLTGRLFGYEGELAVKNSKRNGRRTRNIVFALAMSIILFLSVANFSSMFGALMKDQFDTSEIENFRLILFEDTDVSAIEKLLNSNDNVTKEESIKVESSGLYTVSVWADNYTEVLEEAQYYLEDNGISYEFVDVADQLSLTQSLYTIVKVFIYGFITLLTLIAVLNIVNTISNSMNERKREFAMLKSVGITPKGFHKMIYLESFRYGILAFIWSIPVSALIHYGMYRFLAKGFDYDFQINPVYYLVAVAAVAVIIGMSLLYANGKIKSNSIIDDIKQDI